MKRMIFAIMGIALCIGIGGQVPAMAQIQQSRTPELRYLEQEKKINRQQNRKIPFECGYKKPIRVAGFVTNPPFGWVDVQSVPGMAAERYFNDGFSYSLFKKLADDLDLLVEGIGFQSYHEAQNALRNGEIDVLLGSYYDKRTLGVGTNILFPSYFSNPIIVMFLAGREKDVKSLDDLKGLKGVIRQEENLYSLFYEILPEGVQLEQISGAKPAYTLLLTGKADYMITSLYAAEAEIRRFKIADKVVLTRTPLMTPELFFVFSNITKCKPLKQTFSQQLKKEKENGTNISKLLFQEIDKWVERFRYAPPLADEISRDLARQPQVQPKPEETNPPKRVRTNYPKAVKVQSVGKAQAPAAVQVPSSGKNFLDSVLNK